MSDQAFVWMRQAADAWNRGDLATAEAVIEAHLAPDYELDPLYLDQVYRGVRAFREMLTALAATWQDYRAEIEDIIDLAEHVLVVVRITGRGSGGGVPVDERIFMLTRSHGAQAVWTKSFASKREALDAVGLSE